jgi:hypothetical protein
VRVFATCTVDLRQLVQWLIQCGVTTVAMESAGVYWIPIYELLELSGIKACLLPSLPSSSVNELKPTPRRSASRWWATGAAIERSTSSSRTSNRRGTCFVFPERPCLPPASVRSKVAAPGPATRISTCPGSILTLLYTRNQTTGREVP